MHLGTVFFQVVEFPDIVLELTPAGDGRVKGVHQPTLVIECTLSKHRIELGSFFFCFWILYCRCKTLSFDRVLAKPFQELPGGVMPSIS